MKVCGSDDGWGPCQLVVRAISQQSELIVQSLTLTKVGLVLSWSRNIWYDKAMWLGLKAFLELLPRPFLELGVGIES